MAVAGCVWRRKMKQMRSLFTCYRQSNVFSCRPKISHRFLYTEEALGLPSYIEAREKVSIYYRNLGEKFRERMAFYLEDPEKYMIFSDDLKHMIHLVENAKDVQLCCQMLKRFNKQSKDLRFGSYIFGPVIMRTCHYLKFPDVAFEFLRDEDYSGLFDQLTSFVVAMDLLLETGNYQKLLEAFEILKNKQLYGSGFPSNVLILVFAGCYKMNTPESYKYALKLLKEVYEGRRFNRRAAVVTAALALKQNDPRNAMEILSTLSANYYTVRNLRLMTFAELDRLEDIFIILNDILLKDVPDISKKPEIFPEVIETLQAAANRNGNKEIFHKTEKLIRSLKQGYYIQTSSLEEILFQPILGKTERQQKNLYSTTNLSSSDIPKESKSKARKPYVHKSLYDMDE